MTRLTMELTGNISESWEEVGVFGTDLVERPVAGLGSFSGHRQRGEICSRSDRSGNRMAGDEVGGQRSAETVTGSLEIKYLGYISLSVSSSSKLTVVSTASTFPTSMCSMESTPLVARRTPGTTAE